MSNSKKKKKDKPFMLRNNRNVNPKFTKKEKQNRITSKELLKNICDTWNEHKAPHPCIVIEVEEY